MVRILVTRLKSGATFAEPDQRRPILRADCGIKVLYDGPQQTLKTNRDDVEPIECDALGCVSCYYRLHDPTVYSQSTA
jgi:hypothetical protein